MCGRSSILRLPICLGLTGHHASTSMFRFLSKAMVVFSGVMPQFVKDPADRQFSPRRSFHASAPGHRFQLSDPL